MYKILLILFVGFFSAQQTCKSSFSHTPLSEDGKLNFVTKNLTQKKLKVPNEYGSVWATPTDIQVYNHEKGNYEDTKYRFDGATCLDEKKCFGKMICLKKGEAKQYEIKIIPGRISVAFREKIRYRFKLSFDTYLFSGCDDYVTDWLYYEN